MNITMEWIPKCLKLETELILLTDCRGQTTESITSEHDPRTKRCYATSDEELTYACLTADNEEIRIASLACSAADDVFRSRSDWK